MSEDSKPENTAGDREEPAPVSNERILYLMALVVAAGTIFGFVFVSPGFGWGFLFGGILSFVNYFWLRATLRDIFEKVVGEEGGRFSALRFFFRYLLLGVILVLIHLTGILPVAAVIFGLTSFAFAVLAEALIKIFAHFFKREKV